MEFYTEAYLFQVDILNGCTEIQISSNCSQSAILLKTEVDTTNAEKPTFTYSKLTIEKDVKYGQSLQ